MENESEHILLSATGLMVLQQFFVLVDYICSWAVGVLILTVDIPFFFFFLFFYLLTFYFKTTANIIENNNVPFSNNNKNTGNT